MPEHSAACTGCLTDPEAEHTCVRCGLVKVAPKDWHELTVEGVPGDYCYLCRLFV